MKAFHKSAACRACAALLAAALLPIAGAHGQPSGSSQAGERFEYVEPPRREETAVTIPPYPADENLQELRLRVPTLPLTVYLDRSSVSVDEDGVVRYTAVLESRGGVRNVSYEGIRCGPREYRRYAYGLEGRLQPLPDEPWQHIDAYGVDQFRRALRDDYFCDAVLAPRTEREILRRLRHPPG